MDTKISNIAIEPNIDGNEEGYFRVEGEIPKNYLKNKKGSTVNLKIGMECESSIVVRKLSYFRIRRKQMSKSFESIKIRYFTLPLILSILSLLLIPNLSKAGFVLATNTMILSTFIVIFVVKKNSFKQEFEGIKKIDWKELILLEIFCCFLSLGIIFLFIFVLFHYFPNLSEIMDEESFDASRSFGYNLLSGVIMAPIIEEFIFRGVILHRISKKWGLCVGTIVSSVIFGILHIEVAIIGAFITGLICCFLYLKYKSILVPILFHFLNNLFVFMANIIDSGSGNEDPLTKDIANLLGGVGTFLLIVSSIYLLKFFKKTWTLIKEAR